MRIQANGVETNYELVGEGDCIVLIHGFTDNMAMWQNQVPVFSQQYKVLTFDVRGHGQTDSPEDKISLDTLADVANPLFLEVVRLLSCLGSANL